ncbi:MAG: hypothetical protein ACSLE1_21380 [Sphingobium sp.]
MKSWCTAAPARVSLGAPTVGGHQPACIAAMIGELPIGELPMFLGKGDQ